MGVIEITFARPLIETLVVMTARRDGER